MPSSACKTNDKKLVLSATTLAPSASTTGTYTLFFFNDTATTEIYTLSLHDALPIFTDRDTNTVAISAHPTIDLVKTHSTINDPDGNGPDVGDTVTYSYSVTIRRAHV